MPRGGFLWPEHKTVVLYVPQLTRLKDLCGVLWRVRLVEEHAVGISEAERRKEISLEFASFEKTYYAFTRSLHSAFFLEQE